MATKMGKNARRKMQRKEEKKTQDNPEANQNYQDKKNEDSPAKEDSPEEDLALVQDYLDKLNPSESDTIVGFWKPTQPFGFLSPQYPSKFTDGQQDFINPEQYLLYHKALLFQDEKMVEEVLKAKTTRDLKKINPRVENFDPQIWDQEKFRILVRGNMLKFAQNPELRDKLLSTMLASKDGSYLAYLSPTDRVWGTGSISSSPKYWKGQNLLGKGLMMIRSRLLGHDFKDK